MSGIHSNFSTPYGASQVTASLGLPTDQLQALAVAATQSSADALSSTPAEGLSFWETLNRVSTHVVSPQDRSRSAAAGLVSNALIQPILKQLRREAAETDTPFTPTNAQNLIGTQFDIQIADRIANSPRMTLTDALADRLFRHGQPQSRVDQTRAFGERNMMQNTSIIPLPQPATGATKPSPISSFKSNSNFKNSSAVHVGVDLHG